MMLYSKQLTVHVLSSVCCLTVQDPSRLAFGGGSFAGIAALMAAMRLPHVFGGVLVESPSLWTGEGRFMEVCAYDFGLRELS
jgi:hypothetical protein